MFGKIAEIASVNHIYFLYYRYCLANDKLNVEYFALMTSTRRNCGAVAERRAGRRHNKPQVSNG